MKDVRILPAGGCAVVVEFGNIIDEAVNRRVQTYNRALAESDIPGIAETIPTYRSLTVLYDPFVIRYKPLTESLALLAEELNEESSGTGERNILEIPVAYGGEFGPDIANVAAHAGMSEEETVKIHSGTDYLIYMLGFAPGFTYLGGLDKRLETPRLATPRLLIPAGSVGIAAAQTGIYPVACPGGWQLIGRTPVKMYDAAREDPILPKAGWYMRFVPVSPETYLDIEKEVEAGTFKINIIKTEGAK